MNHQHSTATKEGVKRARARGVIVGRPETYFDPSLARHDYSIRDGARACGVSRSVYHRFIRGQRMTESRLLQHLAEQKEKACIELSQRLVVITKTAMLLCAVAPRRRHGAERWLTKASELLLTLQR